MDVSLEEVESDKEEDLTHDNDAENHDNMNISHSEKGGSYLLAHQIQEKWEENFLFACYSAHHKGWLCLVCSEYGSGDEYWGSRAVPLHEHPTVTFIRHESSKKHTNSIKKKQELKHMLTKGTIYKQLIDRNEKVSESNLERNR